MKATDFPRISSVWSCELNTAARRFPELLELVSARVTPEAGLAGRAFGFYDESDATIGLSPRLEAEPKHRIEGIVRHELGHACDLLFHPDLGDAKGDEARADAAVALIWGAPPSYDAHHVQTSRRLGTPRPDHLHK